MHEPLDPVAAGVASALKSLLARAGLQAERLANAKPAVDTLASLGCVRKFVRAGDSIEQAIILAVSDAVSTLEPTYGIVADVSLGLRLWKDAKPGSDLYAMDLHRRRAALLENWEYLHELRSVPPPPKPTLRALRLEVEMAALSALAVALTDQEQLRPERRNGIPVLKPAQGEVKEATVPRVELESSRSSAPSLMRSQIPLLLGEFQRISETLRNSLIRDQDAIGWAHDLRVGSGPITAIATAFGLKAMILLENFLTYDLIPVAERLRRATRLDGGDTTRNQVQYLPHVAAVILEALHRTNGTADFSAQLAAIKSGVGPYERTRPFILTTVLEASVQVGSDPDLTRSLVMDLLAARRPYGGLLLWSERAEEHLPCPAPSSAHTARAVRALVNAQAALATEHTSDALATHAREAAEQAAVWLANRLDLGNVSEAIDRPFKDGIGVVYVRHFTAAWVVKALVSVGLPASHPSVSCAVSHIWRHYSLEFAQWTWSNGDVPIWMTVDAVDALRLAALAGTAVGRGIDT